MDLFQSGKFILHSGEESDFKINCDALSDKEMGVIANLIVQILPSEFSYVEGIPEGGLRLARALYWHCSPIKTFPFLIVDDVLTTGNSFKKFQNINDGKVMGAVIFARGICPDWVHPLFEMHHV